MNYAKSIRKEQGNLEKRGWIASTVSSRQLLILLLIIILICFWGNDYDYD